MSTLRQNLAFLMSKHQLTANTLAKETGVPQPTISRILSGESSDPRIGTLQPIAERFNMGVEEFKHVLVEGADAIQLSEPVQTLRESVQMVGHLTGRRGTHFQNPGRNLQPRSTGNAVKVAREQFYEALRDDLKEYASKPLSTDLVEASAGGARIFLEYSSPLVAVDFWAGQFLPTAPYACLQSSFLEDVLQKLWNLSTLRLTHKEQGLKPQKIFVFLFMFPAHEETERFVTWVAKPPEVDTLISQAALHGISVIVASPEVAASIVADAEYASKPGR